MPTRMAMYQRLAKASTIEDIDDLPREFEDRFGRRLPDELRHLLYGVRVRILAKQAGIESVVRRRGTITLKLRDEAGGARLVLQKALGNSVTVGNQQIHLPEAAGTPWEPALLEEVGGARFVFQKALGNSVTVGNQQIHLPEAADRPWEQALLEVLERTDTFLRGLPALEAARR